MTKSFKIVVKQDTFSLHPRWTAFVDGQEESGVYGEGKTYQDAIEDLLAVLE